MPDSTVALVTGGSKGIGQAISLALARSGLTVAVGYRSDPEGAEETVAKARAEGGQANSVQLDVTDEESVGRAFGDLERGLAPAGVLVNNAGMNRNGLLVRYPTELWDGTIAVNLRGAFLCTRRALMPMIKARWGRIVNIASIAGLKGNAGQAAYSASKAGLIGLTRSLAREVGSRGITVNAVCPGFVETRMTEGTTGDWRQVFLEQTPAGRFGNPEEIAAAVEFLARPEASYVNGAVITVDGGLTA
jgi:3-oxoacyl-[acyl-carrier protein] reductase